MKKEEIINHYKNEKSEDFEPRYGDTQTTESLEKCYEQVMEKIESGVEEWDGCTGKALCCKQFTHKIDLLHNAKTDALLGAHFKGDKGEYPITLRINHRCNQLNDQDKCGIYEERPKLCREYLCQASKLRRDMFWRIKYPEAVELARIRNEANKERPQQPKATPNEREDAQNHG